MREEASGRSCIRRASKKGQDKIFKKGEIGGKKWD